MLINQFLLLGAFLFATGVYGVLARKNAVLVLMSIELILNAVNLNLIAFALNNGSDVNGLVIPLIEPPIPSPAASVAWCVSDQRPLPSWVRTWSETVKESKRAKPR